MSFPRGGLHSHRTVDARGPWLLATRPLRRILTLLRMLPLPLLTHAKKTSLREMSHMRAASNEEASTRDQHDSTSGPFSGASPRLIRSRSPRRENPAVCKGRRVGGGQRVANGCEPRAIGDLFWVLCFCVLLNRVGCGLCF